MATMKTSVVCAECKEREIASFKIYCTRCRSDRLDILLDLRNKIDKTGKKYRDDIARIDERLRHVTVNLRGQEAKELASV